MLNIGVLASGRGSNFQAIIDARALGSLDVSIRCLITDNPEAYAIKRAQVNGIPHIYVEFTTKDAFYQTVVKELKARNVGLVVLAGFMRIVKQPLIDAFPMKIINIHPALLPAFKGLHGQQQAIDYGVRISGCTAHFVDEGIDTGPIIVQAAVPVFTYDTEESLSARILKREHEILPYAIKLIAEDRISIKNGKVKIKGESHNDDFLQNPHYVFY